MIAATAIAALALAATTPATITDCDRLAAHPSDPDRVAPGVAQPQVDLARAIPACQAAVAADPANPRLNYQLARTLGYAGRGAEAGPYRDAAVKADYPQALFVVGFITLFGLNAVPADPCRAADLIRRSALKGRLAGQLGFPAYALAGRFKGCPTPIVKSEMQAFVEAAAKTVGTDYFQGLLVESLRRELAALPD
ncbi:hypothetical protein [Sandaracinobacteroides saxicola]|uniref:Sel1 repeat family protein n=1 Tax=Sandaracinobacteroides saxicola TaxID=2759707 RepID=A0A7G5IED8_9SPHN|nr:hypothetical protein [Sandaracinobacteroides saxicola]QMW21730.1 hypothetical protein H3309_09950 [Sandaracinobacteroides saxicola]